MRTRIRAVLGTYWRAIAFLGVFVGVQVGIAAIRWGAPLVWDSSVYVGMGKAIFSGWTFGLWESFRPVVISLLSGSLWALGVPMQNVPRLFGVGFAVLSLAAFYVGTTDLLDRKRACTALLLLGACFPVIRWSNYFLTGIPAMGFVWGALYAVRRGRDVWGGVWSGLAFLTRFPAALVGVPILLFLAVRRDSSPDAAGFLEGLSRYAGGGLLVVGPFLIVNHLLYGNALHPLIAGVSMQAGNPNTYAFGLWYPIEALRAHHYVFAGAFLLAPVGLYSGLRDRVRIDGLPASALFAFYAFFALYPHKELRFALLFLPFLAYFAAQALHDLADRVGEGTDDVRGRRFVRGMRILLVAGFLFGAFQFYETVRGQHDDRRAFLRKGGDRLTGTVVANSPQVVSYADVRLVPVRPEALVTSRTFEVDSCLGRRSNKFCRVRGAEVDYVVLNTCAWYCTPSIDQCQSKIDQLVRQIEADFDPEMTMTDEQCVYTLYKRDG